MNITEVMKSNARIKIRAKELYNESRSWKGGESGGGGGGGIRERGFVPAHCGLEQTRIET